MWKAFLCLFFLAGCSHGGGNSNNPQPTPPPVQQPSQTVTVNPLDYIAQSICGDGSIPTPSCPDGSSPAQASTTSVMTQRRGDWGPNDSPYSMQDSTLGAGYALTTWMFSGDTQFVAAHGDGGEVYAVNNGNLVATQTQDGGTPQMQYFVGGTGWVYFPLTVGVCSSGWTQLIATLNISLGAPTPPNGLNTAPTRACLYPNMPFPAIVNGQHVTLTADTIITEHYSGGPGIDVASSTALERDWFAKGYGRIGWAAWNVGAQPVDPVRYPAGGMPMNDQTMGGAVMNDVRIWTNIVKVAPFRVADFGWP